MENSLNIVTYNIHNGSNQEAIMKNIKVLARQSVSLFCLQEVRKQEGREFIVEALLKDLGSEWKAEYFIKPQSFDLGLCILWKTSTLVALNFEALLLPKLNKLSLHEKIVERLINKHKTVAPIQRGSLIGDFNFQGQLVRVTNVHLDWHGGKQQRGRQIQFIKDHLKPKTAAYFEICCGDFNTLGFYRFSQKGSKNIKQLLEPNFESAFKNQKIRSFFLQTLDHIFLKNFKVIKAEILNCKGSDHLPLLAEVKI